MILINDLTSFAQMLLIYASGLTPSALLYCTLFQHIEWSV